MTAMTDEKRVSDDKLHEIIAGCEGVTPGPWTYGAQWLCAKVGSGAETRDYLYLAQVPLNDYDSPRWNADMAHVARLDPQTAAAICSELLARRSQQEPDGWQLVPVEPTREMILAAEAELENQTDSDYDSDADGNRYPYSIRRPGWETHVYAAMLAAAPSPREGK